MLLTQAYFDDAFKGVAAPGALRNLVQQLCGFYRIEQAGAPLSTVNMAAVEFSCGDGEGIFNGDPQIDAQSSQSFAARFYSANYQEIIRSSPHASQWSVLSLVTQIFNDKLRDHDRERIAASALPRDFDELMEHPDLIECWVTPQAAKVIDGPLMASTYLRKGNVQWLRENYFDESHAESHEGLARRYEAGERCAAPDGFASRATQDSGVARVLEPKQVAFSLATGSVIDVIGADGRGEHSRKTLDDMRVRYPDIQVTDAEGAERALEDSRVSPVARRVTPDELNSAFGMVPPYGVVHAGDTFSFKQGEHIYGDVTTIYARVGADCFALNDRGTVSHEQIIAKVRKTLELAAADASVPVAAATASVEADGPGL